MNRILEGRAGENLDDVTRCSIPMRKNSTIYSKDNDFFLFFRNTHKGKKRDSNIKALHNSIQKS